MERFLEDYITDDLTDVYGSMSYSVQPPREGEYNLDSETHGNIVTVWADLCLTPEQYSAVKWEIENDYKKFSKHFEDKVRNETNWEPNIMTRDEDNVLVLQLTSE